MMLTCQNPDHCQPVSTSFVAYHRHQLYPPAMDPSIDSLPYFDKEIEIPGESLITPVFTLVDDVLTPSSVRRPTSRPQRTGPSRD
jgi:hypothetical protein